MRVAVLADIHGYDLAFETVLADLDATGPYDSIVIAGDLCAGGPRPDRVIEIINDRGFRVIQGNTDLDIVNDHERSGNSELNYAREQIGQDGVEWLAKLPLEERITPPGGVSPDDDLLIVHANPHDLLRALDPGYSNRELKTILEPVQARAIAFGHIHICYIRQVDDYLLVDVSAVGNPKDGDLQCKYGVLTWNPSMRRWDAELRKLPYPLEATAAEMEASGMPNWKKSLKKLKRATYKHL